MPATVKRPLFNQMTCQPPIILADDPRISTPYPEFHVPLEVCHLPFHLRWLLGVRLTYVALAVSSKSAPGTLYFNRNVEKFRSGFQRATCFTV